MFLAQLLPQGRGEIQQKALRLGRVAGGFKLRGQLYGVAQLRGDFLFGIAVGQLEGEVLLIFVGRIGYTVLSEMSMWPERNSEISYP